MDTQDEIQQLQNRLNRLKDSQRNCNHTFADAIYDPETIKEAYAGSLIGCGSDPYYETLFRDKTIDRWSRKCTICGAVQYTYKQEPVIKEYKPKF